MRSVELFAGAGGLAMGISNAGFRHEAVVEWNKHACQTIRANQERRVQPVIDWPLYETDVRDFDYSGICEGLDLLAGGPPCQPFSLGGRHGGYSDERNMFPEVVKATRILKPKAVIFENVKGLLRQSFAKYLEYILLQITYPDLIRKENETWMEHLSKLEQYHTSGKHDGLHYQVVFRLLNAADYGVPQKRERVFIVGFRGDLGAEWSFPSPSHSYDSLLWTQYVTGEYWEQHKIPQHMRPSVSPRFLDRVERLRSRLLPPHERPWLTMRDAIGDLPDPENWGYIALDQNHKHNPGARSYQGHTGSLLDEPAKTLKAGDHGVPGGENMLVLPNGRLRYLTIRESARLQTFPDNYVFEGSWTESMRQLGNAVPVALANNIASSVRRRLETTST